MRKPPVPSKLLRVAREYADGVRTPAEPRNAATVVLLRAGATDPEVYLLRRTSSMAFAAGMSVFPGGGVDERDFSPVVRRHWAGPTSQDWADRLDADALLAQALVCAAVRETFEESGVLLAGATDGTVVSDTTGEDWEADRHALESRDLSMTDLLERRGLVLRTDLMAAWAAWLTPVFEPRRFRTWFFVAELPAGQLTRDVSSESDHAAWEAASQACARVERGELNMMPPTYLTCAELAEYADPGEVLAVARKRSVKMFLPEVIGNDDAATMTVPPGAEDLLARRNAP